MKPFPSTGRPFWKKLRFAASRAGRRGIHRVHPDGPPAEGVDREAPGVGEGVEDRPAPGQGPDELAHPTVISFRLGTVRTRLINHHRCRHEHLRPPIVLTHLSGTSHTFGSPATGFSSFSCQLLRALAISGPFITEWCSTGATP